MYTPPLYHWPPKSAWDSTPSSIRRWGPFSVYFHFPFCRNICNFCSYETRLIDKPSVAQFSESATLQLRRHIEEEDFNESRLRSIFFGGGTASIMPIDLMERLFATLDSRFQASECSEVTLECEPGTIGKSKLRHVKNLGVNRIGVCAQSFDDTILKNLGRKHTTTHSLYLISDAVTADIPTIHVDLIYGIPGQTMSDWEKTLNLAITLPIDHVSVYKLYIFKHGTLHRNGHVRAENESPAETETAERMYATALQIFGSAGFEQYTLTEFARPGARSEYIRNCFDGNDLLPIGPSAFGRCDNQIWENSSYVRKFAMEPGADFSRAYYLKAVEAFKRDTILGLWLLKVDVYLLAEKYRVVLLPKFRDLLKNLSRAGLVKFADGTLSLAAHQRFHAGYLMERLADLSVHEWARPKSEEPEQKCPTPIRPNITAQVPKTIGPLLRIARQDADLYRALRTEPCETLRDLGYDTQDTKLRSLIHAIEGTAAPEGSDVSRLQQVWQAIAGEHGKNRGF